MARRKQRSATRGSKLRNEVESLERLVYANARAAEEGPQQRKKWTIHDLRDIKPLTNNQEEMFHSFFQGNNLCASGSAGTGKTFLALYLAFNEILSTDDGPKRVIIVRSAVPTRDMGFMPGDLDEKMSFYEVPYRDILAELFGRKATYDDMKVAGKVQFMPTSYIRGLTWDDAVVVIDEGENMTFHEINSVMTRIGNNSRVIFTGDMVQTDLRKSGNDSSGMQKFLRVLEHMSEFDCVHFTKHDIVRSAFVKSWIIAAEEVDD